MWISFLYSMACARAVTAGFKYLLTRDQLFGESASQAPKQFPEFAVVVVNVPQCPWPEYREEFLAEWRERPIESIAGELIQWP